jgi:crotonobetainyl-CoA:carnitine CoA-transferase CaiB-like acyl-CoA transferase
MDRLEKTGLPFAPIGKPEELLDDPHLNANEGLLDVTVTEGEHKGATMRLPALPLAMGGARFGVHQDIARAGQHTREVLVELGYGDDEIDDLVARGIIASS